MKCDLLSQKRQACSRCSNRSADDSAEFLVFPENHDNSFRLFGDYSAKNSQPHRRLIQLFVNNSQLVNEIRPTLGPARFRVVRGRGCTGTQDLDRDVAAGWCSG